MRTSKPTIKFVIKHQKKNKDGMCPVFVNVNFHGRVEKSCKINVIPSLWRDDHVTPSHPNAKLINSQLNDLQLVLMKRVKTLEERGQYYTSLDVFAEPSSNELITLSYESIMERYITEHNSSKSGATSHRYAFSKLCEFMGRASLDVDELTEARMKNFASFCDNKGFTASTSLSIFDRIASIVNYSIDKDLIDYKSNPFKSFKYKRRFVSQGRDYALTEFQLTQMIGYYLDIQCQWDKQFKSWKLPTDYSYVFDRCGKHWAVGFFLVIFKLNGASPVDVACLKKENVEVVKVGDKYYYHIHFQRRKTQVPVDVMWQKDELLAQLLFEPYLASADERKGYIYPIIYGLGVRHPHPESPSDSCRNMVSTLMGYLHKACEAINEKMKELGKGDPIKVDKVVYYTARHTFASIYLDQSKASVRGLCTLLGRSPNNISTYIHALKGKDELVELSDVMPF